MRTDDRFEDLVASLGGFYRTWHIYVGLELGLLQRLREAGAAGMTAEELAQRSGTQPGLVRDWAWGADAHDIVTVEEERISLPEDVAIVLLDADRSEYLGGQFLHAATGSLDFAELLDVFRTGIPVAARPDRYRIAIERLTVQDIAVFFQEVLSSLPELVIALGRSPRILDVHCGGGRWLIAMARRFREAQLVGVEFEPDSVARARANVAAAVLTDRISIEQRDVAAIGHRGEFDLAYFQYALHQLPDAPAALRSAWDAVTADGWLVTLDWYVPTDPEELRSRHGELIAGMQLDELLSGTRLVERSEALSWFQAAGILAPQLIDLPSGATAIVARR
jgi:SAM-dependent methyltransferase